MSPRPRPNPPVKKIKLKALNLEFEAHEVPPWLVLVMIIAVVAVLILGAIWGSRLPNLGGNLLPMRHGSVTITEAVPDS